MPFPTIDSDMLDTGVTEGQIPLIGAGGKLDTALIDTGTTVGKIIQLDSSARLPALDGSQITNLPGGGVGGSGSRVLLDTVIANNTAEVVFSNFIDATYDNYLIEMTGIRPSTGSPTLQAQVSDDGGATFLTSYDQHTQVLNNNSGSYNAQVGNADPRMDLAVGVRAIGTPTGHGHLIMHDPSVVQNHTFSGRMAFVGAGGDASGGAFYGELSGSHIVNAIKFFLSAGNFVTGTFKLYGLL